MSEVAPYRIHRMIQDLLKDRDAAERFATAPQPTFTLYGVTREEAALLEDRSIVSMDKLGVHPNLQMKYLRLRKESPTSAPPGSGPLDAYLDKFLGN